MSKFSSSAIRVDRPAADISDKFSDLTMLQALVDKLPEPERAKLGDVEFSQNAIMVKTAQVGAITFEVVERTPELVKFKAVGSPVNVVMDVELAPVDVAETDLTVSMDMDIPMMLRPLIAPHLQRAVDMLAGVIAKVSAE